MFVARSQGRNRGPALLNGVVAGFSAGNWMSKDSLNRLMQKRAGSQAIVRLERADVSGRTGRSYLSRQLLSGALGQGGPIGPG
jgi:hypothetical protein